MWIHQPWACTEEQGMEVSALTQTYSGFMAAPVAPDLWIRRQHDKKIRFYSRTGARDIRRPPERGCHQAVKCPVLSSVLVSC